METTCRTQNHEKTLDEILQWINLEFRVNEAQGGSLGELSKPKGRRRSHDVTSGL